MKVRRCSVAGMIYGAPMTGGGEPLDVEVAVEKQLSSTSLSSLAGSDTTSQGWTAINSIARFRDLPVGEERELLVDFLRIMAACNTVMLMPDAHTGELHVSDKASLEKCLQAESADEVALVTAAVEFADIILTKRDVRSITIKGIDNPDPREDGKNRAAPKDFKEWANRSPIVAIDTDGGAPTSRDSEETYDVLAVNVFDSDRKRMSILVRMNGEYVLLCKGADTSMLPLCSPNQYYEQCAIHIDQFATSGLRTLVFAKRKLSEKEAMRWLGDYSAASNSLVNRPEMLSRCAVEIEQRMDLLGAVGIEDELQVHVVFVCIRRVFVTVCVSVGWSGRIDKKATGNWTQRVDDNR